MLEALLVGPRQFQVVENEIPTFGDSQVLIKVHACGICSSEIPVFLGTAIGTPGVSFRYRSFPAKLGHEVVGEVVSVGRFVTDLKEGDRVTGFTYSGNGFAEYFVEQGDMLIKVPDKFSLDLALAIGEPLAATINIIRQAQLDYGDTVLVTGDGYMSMLLIASLSRLPLAQLIVVGHHDSRLELAISLGAHVTFNAKRTDAWEEIMAITSGMGVQAAIEYAGTSSALQLAASVCQAKARAKLVLAASYSNDMPFTIGNYLQNRAPIVVPAYPNQSYSKHHDLQRAMWALGQGFFPVERLVTHRFSIYEVGEGYELALSRECGYLKGIVNL